MSKRKILLLFSNHRVAEKLWPIIPELSETYSIDLFLIGLYSFETPWIGDFDERVSTTEKYNSYIDNIIVGPGVKFHGDSITKDLLSYVNLDNYEFVIFDDDRAMTEYNVHNFYKECKARNIPMISNVHGNEDTPHNIYNKCMTFKLGGIPANDTLSNVELNPKHILLITNFLGCRSSIFPVNFDERFVNQCGVNELSKHYNLPIKVKIKTRLDNPNYKNEINYIKNILDCEVIANTDNIDKLIGESAIVIAAPSTLCFKPIQLGIPTVIIKGAGQIGHFSNFAGLVELNTQKIFDKIQLMSDNGKYSEWIENTITGGSTFTSSKVYVENLKGLI